jgi:hypothetical protein
MVSVEISWFLMQLFWGILGSFGTAYVHERTGRDIRMGGLIGLVVGFVLGPVFLVMFWLWVYYRAGGFGVRAYNARQHWYRWWE